MLRLLPGSQIALPAAVGLYLLASGATLPGVMMLVMAGVAAFAFYLWYATSLPAQWQVA